MNKPFLARVAEDIYRRKGGDLGNCVFIFPNKRPEEYLQLELAKLTSTQSGAPKMLSIEEFIYSHSSLQQADPLQLIFILYKIYIKYLPDEDFEKFYAWGNMLLKDFDEIDRYMAPAEKLFSHLKAIKEIEHAFIADYEPLTEPVLNENEPHFLQKRFLYLWQVYRCIYNDFQKYLIEQKLAYPGMAYREVAGKCIENKFETGGKYFVFIGFNALSTAEEAIIKTCTQNGNGCIYWDADIYYLENEREEAGHFIREAVKKLPPPPDWKFDNRLQIEAKKINIIGVPLKTGQAKALGVEVKKHFSAKPYMENAAVVLPDENMLLPVMHALPHNEINVHSTSGYQLTNSSFYALLEQLFALQENFKDDKQSFYYKDVISVLNHPLVACRQHKEIREIIAEIEKKEWIYIDKKYIEKFAACGIVTNIFSPAQNAEQLIIYTRNICDDILTGTPMLFNSEKVMVHEVQEIINQLEKLLQSQQIHLNRSTFLRLFREAAAQKRIPLQINDGNALKVMGMLETRSLGFDTIFMLSVNEGILPPGKRNHSFIPYEVRKAYKLPTFDEQDALSAYYFFRLIQGAREVYLFYNSETGSKGEEKSRYLRQLEYYLAKANKNLEIIYRNYSLPLRNNTPKDIIIKKDEPYFDKILQKSSGSGISPSFISSYYACSLQFLINYVIGLQAKTEISEDMDAAELGTLFHDTMQKIYTPYIGKTVTTETIKSLKNGLNDVIEDILLKKYESQKEHIAGRNSLTIETVKVLAEKTLEADAAYAPFHILHLEKKLTHTIEIQLDTPVKINLQGKIDRIDEKDGIVRIVDYKTGMLEGDFFDYNNLEETISGKNKEAFQTLFYTYLYKQKFGGEKLQPNILPLKKVNEGYVIVNSKNGELTDNDFIAFESKLKQLLSAIFDKEKDILQVEDRGICAYCDYTYFCLR